MDVPVISKFSPIDGVRAQHFEHKSSRVALSTRLGSWVRIPSPAPDLFLDVATWLRRPNGAYLWSCPGKRWEAAGFPTGSKGRRWAAPQACAWASRTGSSRQAAGGHGSTKIERHRPLPAPKKGRSLPKWVVPFGALQKGSGSVPLAGHGSVEFAGAHKAFVSRLHSKGDVIGPFAHGTALKSLVCCSISLA